MEYRYVVKSVIGYKNIGNENFEHVIKVPLLSPRDIPRIYKSFLESHKNVKILKKTSNGWIEVKLKVIEKDIPKGYKKAYKVII